jgi:hypothetical protein
MRRFYAAAVLRYCSPPADSHASCFVHGWTLPHAEHTVVAVTDGSCSTSLTSIPVDTGHPFEGQVIMMIAMIPSSFHVPRRDRAAVFGL